METIWDSYGEAEAFLLEVPKFTSKNNPEDTRKFLRTLGSPEENCKIIHVAGTNGKGSVCAYLCSVLKQTGIRTGMFTSPHLVEMRERFRVNGELISEERFLWGLNYVMGHLEEARLAVGRAEYHPTFFELLFLMGMVIFREEKAEYLVLETGLGGRLDATNAVEHPVLTVITEIGMDHMEYLGNTIGEIAAEKAGILKPGVPVVFCDKRKEASRVIRERAETLGNRAVGVGKKDYFYKKLTNKSIDFSMQCRYYDYIRLSLATPAVYQAENAAVAVRCMEELKRLDGDRRIACMTEAQLRKGLEEAVWEGRMEEVLPGIFVDGAHNEDGIRAFAETVRTDGCTGGRMLVFSAVADKDYKSMIRILQEGRLFDAAAVVGIRSGRAAEPERLRERFVSYNGGRKGRDGSMEIMYYRDMETALPELRNRKKADDFIYIVGSLYLVGEVKALLRRRTDD